MYLDYFKLKDKPFALSTDPRFLWAGANQRQALATLTYGLKENRGIVVLGGEFGVGKTTLVNAFVQRLDDRVGLFRLNEPGADLAEFRLAVAEGFGIRIANPHKEGLAETFLRLEDDHPCYQKRLLLIIDEAQRLTAEMQADVLRLAQLENEGARRLHIVLVGQNEIYHWADSTTREALLSQVSATCRLYSLNGSETAAYIDLRLRVAGAKRPLFEKEAVNAIHNISGGVPRAINLICDFSLMQAHMNGADKVDAKMVDICKDRFQITAIGDEAALEVSERALTLLPTKPQTLNRRKLSRGLGLSMPVLLVLLAAGFWFVGGSDKTTASRDAANSAPSQAMHASPPLSSAPSHLLPERPSANNSPRKAATSPFANRPPEAEQAALRKTSPDTSAPNPETIFSPSDAHVRNRKSPVDQPGEEQIVEMPTLPSVTQQSPMNPSPVLRLPSPETIAAEAENTAVDRQPRQSSSQKEPAESAEPNPANNPLPRADLDDDTQRPTVTQAPKDADPGDIIDWLIQKNQKGGPSKP